MRALAPLPVVLLALRACSAAACDASADMVVWGGTVCGATASVAAVRSDPTLRVLWLVNGSRLGGMTSGGLGGVDCAMPLGGLAAELFTPLGRRFEPHVAEDAVAALTATAGAAVTVARGTGWLASAAAEGSAPRRVTSVTTLGGRKYCGKVFIDCSYEGDLLRFSGTEFAVGREARAEYNESLAGRDGWGSAELGEKPMFFAEGVSPFVDAANTSSGLLPTVNGTLDGSKVGEGDDWVMSYCFRMCLTNNTTNAVPIDAPEGYSVAQLGLLVREINAMTARGIQLSMRNMFLISNLPNMKIDLNSAQWSAPMSSTQPGGGRFPFSTDLPFAQHDWPLGNATTRARVFAEHKWWTQAMLYYLANDEDLRKMQPALVADVASYGLCGDEYGGDHWTPQLYVRESVRLRGAKVVTQEDVCHPTMHPASTGVGLSKWGVDIHGIQRLALKVGGEWRVVNAGGRDTGKDEIAVCEHREDRHALEVPYEAFTPRADDTANLLVPVCASFTHVAFAAYRLEPQYAIFGHSAGAAAALALRADPTAPVVQRVNTTQLRALLQHQKQRLQ